MICTASFSSLWDPIILSMFCDNIVYNCGSAEPAMVSARLTLTPVCTNIVIPATELHWTHSSQHKSRRRISLQNCRCICRVLVTAGASAAVEYCSGSQCLLVQQSDNTKDQRYSVSCLLQHLKVKALT